jgi:CHAD domain-containing protein
LTVGAPKWSRAFFEVIVTTETQQFAIEQARQSLRHLTSQIDRSRSAGPEAVHQLRVAIRRFTQAAAASNPCFSGKEARKIRRRLKKLMEAAGEVRDYDVALKLVAKWRLPDQDQLQKQLRSHRKQCETVLLTQLEKWKQRHMAQACRSVLDAPADRSRAFSGGGVRESALERIAKDFRKRATKAVSENAQPHDLHRFRIITKKLRYTLELFQPLLGPSVDREVALLKRAGRMLGDINDCVTTVGLLARFGASSRIAARLNKRQHRRTEEFRSYWKTDGDTDNLRIWIDRLANKKKPAARSESHSPRKAMAGSIRVARIAGT